MAELKATVVIEKVIHDVLKETIQKIADEHKIMIEDISVSWAMGMSDSGIIVEISERSFSR